MQHLWIEHLYVDVRHDYSECGDSTLMIHRYDHLEKDWGVSQEVCTLGLSLYVSRRRYKSQKDGNADLKLDARAGCRSSSRSSIVRGRWFNTVFSKSSTDGVQFYGRWIICSVSLALFAIWNVGRIQLLHSQVRVY